MKIIIVDDNIDKISQITKSIFEISSTITVDSVEDIQTAILEFKKNRYELAIIDILLPVKKDDKLESNGGMILVNEIERQKNNIYFPDYLIGLTAYNEYEANFSTIWKVLHYDVSETKWSDSLKKLIGYIQKVKSQPNSLNHEVKPSIFVEGKSDIFLLKSAFNFFNPKLLERIEIVSKNNSGANWVASQLVIWGNRLALDSKGNYLKAIGLLDSDEAGNLAKKEVHRVLTTTKKQSTCRVFQLSPNYSDDVLDFYKSGCKIEIEVETLFPLNIQIAIEKKGWLENRSPVFTSSPNDWNSFDESAKDFLKGKGFNDNQLLLTKKVKITKKKAFCDFIDSLSKTEKQKAFSNFEGLIKDIEEYFIKK